MWVINILIQGLPEGIMKYTKGYDWLKKYSKDVKPLTEKEIKEFFDRIKQNSKKEPDYRYVGGNKC